MNKGRGDKDLLGFYFPNPLRQFRKIPAAPSNNKSIPPRPATPVFRLPNYTTGASSWKDTARLRTRHNIYSQDRFSQQLSNSFKFRRALTRIIRHH